MVGNCPFASLRLRAKTSKAILFLQRASNKDKRCLSQIMDQKRSVGKVKFAHLFDQICLFYTPSLVDTFYTESGIHIYVNKK